MVVSTVLGVLATGVALLVMAVAISLPIIAVYLLYELAWPRLRSRVHDLRT